MRRRGSIAVTVLLQVASQKIRKSKVELEKATRIPAARECEASGMQVSHPSDSGINSEKPVKD